MGQAESTPKRVIWFCSDTLARILERIKPSSTPRHSPSDIDDIPDEKLLQLVRNSEFQFPSTAIGTHNVSRVTEHTVMKMAQDRDEGVEYPSEALVLQLVAQQTSIPVPQVRRFVKAKTALYIAMEHIPGEQLSAVWPTLSWFGRVRIAFKMHSYIRQLRKIRHPRSSIPGPMGVPGEGGRICPSPLWGPIVELRGPFATYADLTHFLNGRLALILKSERKQPPSLETLTTCDDTQPLVLTHQDLNPRNFIVGDDGHLWLVDWAWSGFYPPWFEFVAMRRQAENEELVTGQKNPEWDAMVPVVCGWFFAQERWIDRIYESLNWS
ncbi:hypothetical protein M413DRAFT_442946 [Hebeloma cylindrosporum]|uniref:Aminoglycoside phosphotransferase domain-containing protein n=1 Tax=Hebeloma cylindrosporum TaxID=76867 RepID=A0A0C3C814_HEBCY|nr:hypothetical protein M413DRAFT_442946 [Hebeloma cylindrosporum h7]